MSGVQLQRVGTRISQCSDCETPLPLCEATNPDDARTWVCSECGTEYRAMLARDYSIAELRGVRHEPVIFDRNAIEQVDRDLLAFAHRFGASDNHRVEKRSSPRHAVIATLTAQEFDQQLHPVGPPFQTVCRNLSTSGLCLINGHPIGCDFLVIELSAPGAVLIQTLARVLRRRPLGPYHDIGIEFVTKLANSNTKRTEQ